MEVNELFPENIQQAEIVFVLVQYVCMYIHSNVNTCDYESEYLHKYLTFYKANKCL